MPSIITTMSTLLGAVFALALVLFCAWVILRFINKRIPGLSGGASGRLIKVLDRVNVTRSSCILLLRVEEKVLLVSMTEHSSETLCEFQDPEGKIVQPPAEPLPDFSTAMKDAIQRLSKKDENGGDKH